MRRSAVIAAIALFVAVGLIGCGGDEAEKPPQTATPTTVTTTPEAEVERPPAPDAVVIVAGETVSGGGRKRVTLGKVVRLQVISDTADEVHLHGYDKKVDVATGRPANLTFTADVPGVFEVELEKRGLKLLDLVVR